MLKPLLLSEVAQALGARVVGADVAFTAVSTDSRRIEAGQLFIALVGPNFDGHDYLADVAAKGAVAALVQREVPGAALPQLVVDDTRIALGQLGAQSRGLPQAAGRRHRLQRQDYGQGDARQHPARRP